MGRHWADAEVAAACKAYAKATLNPLVGTDQDLDQFAQEIALQMEEVAPPDVQPGMYHHRGTRIYPYLRDCVFPQLQKFNKALRHIYACNPTGVTEQQKINMAVALFKKVVKGMDYEYKDYDAAKHWKMYGGWLAVCHLAKFQINSGLSGTSVSSDSPDSDAAASSGAEFVETQLRSRGTKRGREAAKVREKEAERVRKRNEERDRQFTALQKGVEDISAELALRNRADIVAKALSMATDPTQKQILQEKLVAMALGL